MGSYTKFELDIVVNGLSTDGWEYWEERDKHKNEISKIAGFAFNPFHSESKWYNHENDVKEHSVKYPDIVFVLRGDSDDKDEGLYVKYFQNGKMQHEQIQVIVPKFDKTKLI